MQRLAELFTSAAATCVTIPIAGRRVAVTNQRRDRPRAGYKPKKLAWEPILPSTGSTSEKSDIETYSTANRFYKRRI